MPRLAALLLLLGVAAAALPKRRPTQPEPIVEAAKPVDPVFAYEPLVLVDPRDIFLAMVPSPSESWH